MTFTLGFERCIGFWQAEKWLFSLLRCPTHSLLVFLQPVSAISESFPKSSQPGFVYQKWWLFSWQIPVPGLCLAASAESELLAMRYHFSAAAPAVQPLGTELSLYLCVNKGTNLSLYCRDSVWRAGPACRFLSNWWTCSEVSPTHHDQRWAALATFATGRLSAYHVRNHPWVPFLFYQ